MSRTEHSFNQLVVRKPDQINYKDAINTGLTQLILVDRPLDSNRSVLASLEQTIHASESDAVRAAYTWTVGKFMESCLCTGAEAPITEDAADLLCETLEHVVALDKVALLACIGIEAQKDLLCQLIAGLPKERQLEAIDAFLAFFEDDENEVRAEISPVMLPPAQAIPSHAKVERFDLGFTSADCETHTPDSVRVCVTPKIAEHWLALQRVLALHGVHCIEDWNVPPITYLLDGGYESEDFVPDLVRARITRDNVMLAGYEKNVIGNSYWSTSCIPMNDLKNMLVQVPDPMPAREPALP